MRTRHSFISAAGVFATMMTIICLLSCSEERPGPDPSSDIINTWQIVFPAENDPEEIITATFIIKADGTIQTVVESNMTEELAVNYLYWKIEDDKFLFAFRDADGDGIDDSEDELYWESYMYEVSDDELTLTSEDGLSWDYTKSDEVKNWM